jgi:hypothetical protein
MHGIPEATPVILTEAERTELEALARSTTTEYRLRQRARIVLVAAEGVASRAIGRAVGCTLARRRNGECATPPIDGPALMRPAIAERNRNTRPRRISASWPCWMGRFLRGTRVGLSPDRGGIG